MADSPRIEELKRRVHSDPASIAFAALAEEYRRAQRFEEAIETCTAGLIRHPSYLSAHVTLGRALIEVGRLEDARNELEYVLRLAPENLAAIRGLAEIHDRLGEGSHAPVAKGQAPEPAASEMTVAEIQAASGFIPPAAGNTEPAPFSSPTPAEPEPVKPEPRFDPRATSDRSGLAPWEAEPSTPPMLFPWEAEPDTPPAAPSFDSRESAARSGLQPWEAEPAPAPPAREVEPPAPSIPPTVEAEAAPPDFVISMEETVAPEAPPALAGVSQVEQTHDELDRAYFDSAQDSPSASGETTAPSGLSAWEVEPLAPSIPPSSEAEPAPSYFVVSLEEETAPPVLARVSQVEQTPDEPAPPFDFVQGEPFDFAHPSTGSGLSRPKSRDDFAQARPDHGRATGLEHFLKAILRARAERDAFR